MVSAQDYYPFGMGQPGRSVNVDGYRYGFNGQERSGEITGNSYGAEFWEYDSRIGRRWNLDPMPTVGISEYSAFDNNPIWYSDPLGDTIKTYSTAEVTHTTLTEKGGTVDLATNRITIKDALLVPAVTKDGKLVGYHVFDTKDEQRRMPILQIEPGDVEEFKRGYDAYMGGQGLSMQMVNLLRE